ncbi:hypothetical protein FOG51_00014 [Hanseniaspora uvarum]|nr:hypothetical protein FOG51_00014 [Hanseniaspora uvarum]
MSRRASTQFYTEKIDQYTGNKENVNTGSYNSINDGKPHHFQHRSFINHSPNVYLQPIRNEHSSSTINSETHYQKRIVSNATADSHVSQQKQNSNRIPSNGSNRFLNADRFSFTSNNTNYFATESPVQKAATMNSNSSHQQHFNASRHSSFISNEDLETTSTSHYKPYYAKKQQSAAKVQQNYANHAQQRQSYHVANPSITSNDSTGSYNTKNQLSNSNSSYAMALNNNNAKLAQRQSVKKPPTFGPYVLGKTIGEGEFGKVKLGWSKNKKSTNAFNFQMANTLNDNSNGNDIMKQLNGKIDTDDMPKQVAIKLIKNSSIPEGSEAETKLFREINSLRVLTHPNIVRLEEVIRNDTHIGIVLEYASGGEFYKYIQEKKRLKENESCRLFAQLVSGVHYMHSKGMAHRDLKLENLLLDRFENLIITDFGFVNEFHPGKHELMKTSCGSPCYAAPELVVSSRPYQAKKADLWSCGIILFAILAGYLPWDDDASNPDGDDIAKLYMHITQTPLKFPDYIAPIPRDLLRRILVSNPKHRLSMEQVYQHQWLKPHRSFLSITPEEWDRFLSSDNNKVYRSNQNENTKPIRPKSLYSTNGVSSNSLVLENANFPKALPPKESSTFATIKSDNLPAALAVQNMNYPNRRLRHESIDFSQLNNNGSQHGAISTHGRPISFIENSGYNRENSSSAPSLIYKQNEHLSKLSLSSNGNMPNNNSATSFHRRTGSAASVVLQNIIDENDLKIQENNKFQSDRNRRARPMSYQPGSQHYEFKGHFSQESQHDYSHSGYMSFDEISSQKKKKHSSVIQEEEETAGISNDFNNYANQKLERYNQSMFEKENTAMNSNTRKGRNASEASGSTIGTPTIHSMSVNNENYNESNQQTRVPSRGTPYSAHQNNSASGTTSKKNKRFSLLSFYSLYDGNNSSKNQVSNEQDSQRNFSSTSFIEQHADNDDNAKDRSMVSEDSGMDLQSRIFNNEDGSSSVKKGPQRGNSRKQYRNSVMVSDLHSKTSTGTPKKPKGSYTSSGSSGNTNGTPSTTRRVIDFFKRRSIRL